ncbi:undecaprenyl-diphosphatase [Calidifontibacillus oryziterrae]|uniref:undecaprenyl-diphosphatase n=1 Tax=Calidifontibacillus oryziterrae TaxID=1191699 RepID=UPI0002E51BCC|nr:phosphatase PAP2 family protein [Calidifontibacillus oryziterrae]
MGISAYNIELFRMINDLGKHYTALNPVMIFIAEYTIFFLALAVVTLWLSRSNNNRLIVISGVVTLVLSEIVGKIAGKLHTNNQPFAEIANVNQLIEKAVNNSFPSDHTIIFFSFCITFLLFNRGWGFLATIIALIVGFSRIWVGVHYPADVFAGALISIIIAIVVFNVVPKLSWTTKFLVSYEKSEQKIIDSVTKQKETM